MKANKYQRLALRTALLERPLEDQVLNAVLGLAGETGELCEIIQNISTDDGDSLTARYILLMTAVGELGDEIKKNMFNGHTVDQLKLMKLSKTALVLAESVNTYCVYRDIAFDYEFQVEESIVGKLVEELGDALWYIVLACFGIGKKLSDIMKFNIQKLFKRYGDKFSFEKSINRERTE